MKVYSKEELEEALRAIRSTLSKCEKAVVKLKENSAQHTLSLRRIATFRISAELIQKELSIPVASDFSTKACTISKVFRREVLQV